MLTVPRLGHGSCLLTVTGVRLRAFPHFLHNCYQARGLTLSSLETTTDMS